MPGHRDKNYRGKGIFFLNKKDIIHIISNGATYNPQAKAIAGFHLQRMEASLEKNVWIKDAELFFDNNMVFHINVTEREPVARIFTVAGYSFYIDSSGYKMPLSDKMSARLPVFTGFPTNKARLRSADSLLLQHIRAISQHILNDQFWMAQIAQVDITHRRTFELVPTIGNHIIEFGDGENYESKFRRLFIFYSQVLSRKGFDKYNRLNVQYDKQVIGTRKVAMTRIDSVQALKNIQKMIEDSKRIMEDSLVVNSQ